MQSLPISLPFENVPKTEYGIPKPTPHVRVYVIPHKRYGESTGTELLKLYGIGTHHYKETENKPHGYLHWKQEDNLSIFGSIIKGNSGDIIKLSPPCDTVYIKTLHFNTGQLPESIQIGKHHYPFRDIVHIMEDILKEKFICRYDNRCLRQKINTSIEVTLQPSEKGVIIFSKKNICYLLRR